MDPVTSITMANEVANSEVVWALLCILLTGFVIWSQRKDKIATDERNTKERAETIAMMKNFSDGLTSQAATMKEISNGMKSLESRMERIERSTNSYSRGGD